MIPGVVYVGTELRLERFADGEVLHDGEVPTLLAWAADAAEAKGELPVVGSQLLIGVAVETGVDVEPAVDIALIAWKLDVFDIAVEDGVAEAHRTAGLEGDDGSDLPAAEEEVDRAREASGKLAALPDRDFPDTA